MAVAADTDPNRIRWYERAGAWMGIGTGPGVLAVGGGLAARLPLRTLVIAVPVGTVILAALAVTQGILSRHRRHPLVERAEATFGAGAGATLLNAAIALAMIGWMSFYVGLAGAALATLADVPGWLGALGIALAMLALTELGVSRWNLLVWITGLSALGAAIFALRAIGASPSWHRGTEIRLAELLWGIGGVVAYGIVFATRSSDFTWDLEADADVVKAGFALAIPLVIFLAIGAILYASVGDWNLADVLAQHESAWLGNLFLVLSIVAPGLSSVHSGALALESLISIHKRQSAILICGVGFVLGAIRFDRRLLTFLDVLGAAIPPALIVMLVTAMLPRRLSRMTTLTAWLLGAAVAITLKVQGELSHMVAGAGASAVVLLAAVLLGKAQRLRPMPAGSEHDGRPQA